MPEPQPDRHADGSRGDHERRQEGRPTGRSRWLPGRSQIVVGVLLALVGFAAVTQLRTNETDDTYSGLRQQDLIDVLSALAVTRQRTEAEINRLEEVRDDLRDDTMKRQAALAEAQDQVANLRILAGLVPVTGPGIRITITEVTGTVELSTLLDMIQELRTAAAEAIQINGTVRVVAQSSFESVEGGFEVDGQLVPAPYVVDVIGEPSLLAEAMTFGFGPKQQLVENGAEVVVEELSSLDIEAVREPDETQYVLPD